MIRIDEIYQNLFRPWIQDHVAHTRLFFVDPFGSRDPLDLKNFGDKTTEHNYIFMHDQEPIDLILDHDLFEAVITRNKDLNLGRGPTKKAIVTSEIDSDYLDRAINAHGWQRFYYFFHGWAALDWYRGYDRTFLIKPFEQRAITHSFLCPNRIIGGQRHHRLLMLYHLLKRQTQQAIISFPAVCPQENQTATEIAAIYQDRYPDIVSTVAGADLPWCFAGENGHPMSSCWLDLFEESQRALAYVVTETLYFGRRSHLTEKTFKPICLGLPFVLVSTRHSLRYLRSYGFKTFGDFWDESYDHEADDYKRLEMIADLLGDLERLSPEQKTHLYQSMIPIIQHNFNHFYGGQFEALLWTELTGMLDQMDQYFNRS